HRQGRRAGGHRAHPSDSRVFHRRRRKARRPAALQRRRIRRSPPRLTEQGTMIAFQSVSKQYTHGDSRGAYALQDVSLDIAKGELVYLAGPSGAGKSTLMKMVAAVERPSSGKVIVNGQDIGRIKPAGIPFLRRNIGIIFQQQRLLNDRNILANTMLPL